MNRRTFLASAAGAALLVGTGAVSPALALSKVDYSPERLRSLQAAGTPVLLDFYATWCPTCRAQERVLGSLTSNPAYRNIVIMRVDWDRYRTADISRSLRVSRQSTLILMKGNQEVGRLIAQTSESAIKGLLDRA